MNWIARSSFGYKWIAISEFHDFCEIFRIAKQFTKITLLCNFELREER
jgi:hypothetical protein